MDNIIIWSAISILSCLGFMLIFPRLSGVLGNVSFKEEMAQKDNHAAGISVSALMLSVGLVLSGASSGNFGNTVAQEILTLVTYAILGLSLIAVSRIVFDRFVMPGVNLHDEIMKGNKAAAILDAGNTISTALVIHSVMRWSESFELKYILITVLSAWVISQSILFAAAMYRKIVQSKYGSSIDSMIADGNMAAAFRFTGYRLSVAIVIMIAAVYAEYDEILLTYALLDWAMWAAGLAIISTALSYIFKRIILRGIDTRDEIENDRNIGIGLMESSIYISTALIFMGVLV